MGDVGHFAATLLTNSLVLAERTIRSAPELEANDLSLGVSTSGNNDGAEDDANDEDNLESGKPELAFAVNAHRPTVQEREEHNRHANPGSRVDIWDPVADENGDGRQLGGEENDPKVPVEPAHGERHTVADIALCETFISIGL